MHKLNLEDTIAAISTPIGRGGIGIVRMSGNKAIVIADKIFASRRKGKPSDFLTHTVHYGTIIDSKQKDNEVVDEVLLTVMRTPNSYTKEDVVEISCHGGVVPLKVILDLILEKGARLAEPGEFTKRAFLSGRIDLTQAEAVLDIIQAKTSAFLKMSLHQLRGDLSAELESIREGLMEAYIELEAIVNFPEDDVDLLGRERLRGKIKQAASRVKDLLGFSDQGRILREGAKVVICGKPNVGKSSLLNIFLGEPRAIVSKIKGTTRDSIEESAQIKGVPLQFVDTAGILRPRDVIEKEAVKRSRAHIEQADLVLFMLDASAKISVEDKSLFRNLKSQNMIIVLNKCDRGVRIDLEKIKQVFSDKVFLQISALKRQGIDELRSMLIKNIMHGRDFEEPNILISNTRQIESLKKCRTALNNADKHFEEQLSLEFISEEVKDAIHFLDMITGRDIDQDLLDRIFSSFCIGK